MRTSVVLACLMLLLAASSGDGENQNTTGPVGLVSPTPGAPVSARQVEERRKILADGKVTTEVVTSQVYRDSAGRVRMECRLGDGTTGSVEFVYLLDPVASLVIILLPQEKVADRDTVPRSSSGSFQVGLPTTWRPLPKGKWKTKEEALGVRTIEGVETHGTRWVQTSEDEPTLKASFERWSSEALTLTAEEKFVSPNWTHTAVLQNIKRGEPDSALFVVPADYTVRGP